MRDSKDFLAFKLYQQMSNVLEMAVAETRDTDENEPPLDKV